MDETVKESHNYLTSAAAFVESGIQDNCDYACSICLEDFCDSDPSADTICKHEFHLQCILEWGQRSSQCPMCWQPLSLKDPTSQELLQAVEQERNIRVNRAHAPAVLHHPILGDFELHNLPADDAELEEHLIQHLAAAAAVRRNQRHARREVRGGLAANEHPQSAVIKASAENSSGSATVNDEAGRETEVVPPIVSSNPSTPLVPMLIDSRVNTQWLNSGSGEQVSSSHVEPTGRVASGPSTPVHPDRAGPSDLQTLSEFLKSRINSVSARYKESITKSTRSWRERWFSRNSSVSDHADVRDAGLETQNTAVPIGSASQNAVDTSSSQSTGRNSLSTNSISVNASSSASCA